MKIIDNFSQRFLTYSRVTLFLLFALASFNWYDSNDPTKSYITSIVNWIGCISFAAWVYAIGHKANDKLKQDNIQLSIFRFYNLGFIIMLGCILSMYFLSKGNVNYTDTSGVVTYHVTYSQPGWIALIFVSALIFTLILWRLPKDTFNVCILLDWTLADTTESSEIITTQNREHGCR